MKFEIFQSPKNKKHYFRLKSRNGQTVLASEAYSDASGAKKGAQAVQRASTKEANFQENVAKNGKHYFNLVSSNKQIVGTSQMYATKSGCRKCVKSIMNGASGASIVHVES